MSLATRAKLRDPSLPIRDEAIECWGEMPRNGSRTLQIEIAEFKVEEFKQETKRVQQGGYARDIPQ